MVTQQQQPTAQELRLQEELQRLGPTVEGMIARGEAAKLGPELTRAFIDMLGITSGSHYLKNMPPEVRKDYEAFGFEAYRNEMERLGKVCRGLASYLTIDKEKIVSDRLAEIRGAGARYEAAFIVYGIENDGTPFKEVLFKRGDKLYAPVKGWEEIGRGRKPLEVWEMKETTAAEACKGRIIVNIAAKSEGRWIDRFEVRIDESNGFAKSLEANNTARIRAATSISRVFTALADARKSRELAEITIKSLAATEECARGMKDTEKRIARGVPVEEVTPAPGTEMGAAVVTRNIKFTKTPQNMAAVFVSYADGVPAPLPLIGGKLENGMYAVLNPRTGGYFTGSNQKEALKSFASMHLGYGMLQYRENGTVATIQMKAPWKIAKGAEAAAATLGYVALGGVVTGQAEVAVIAGIPATMWYMGKAALSLKDKLKHGEFDIRDASTQRDIGQLLSGALLKGKTGFFVRLGGNLLFVQADAREMYASIKERVKELPRMSEGQRADFFKDMLVREGQLAFNIALNLWFTGKDLQQFRTSARWQRGRELIQMQRMLEAGGVERTEARKLAVELGSFEKVADHIAALQKRPVIPRAAFDRQAYNMITSAPSDARLVYLRFDMNDGGLVNLAFGKWADGVFDNVRKEVSEAARKLGAEAEITRRTARAGNNPFSEEIDVVFLMKGDVKDPEARAGQISELIRESISRNVKRQPAGYGGAFIAFDRPQTVAAGGVVVPLEHLSLIQKRQPATLLGLVQELADANLAKSKSVPGKETSTLHMLAPAAAKAMKARRMGRPQRSADSVVNIKGVPFVKLDSIGAEMLGRNTYFVTFDTHARHEGRIISLLKGINDGLLSKEIAGHGAGDSYILSMAEAFKGLEIEGKGIAVTPVKGPRDSMGLMITSDGEIGREALTSLCGRISSHFNGSDYGKLPGSSISVAHARKADFESPQAAFDRAALYAKTGRTTGRILASDQGMVGAHVVWERESARVWAVLHESLSIGRIGPAERRLFEILGREGVETLYAQLGRELDVLKMPEGARKFWDALPAARELPAYEYNARMAMAVDNVVELSARDALVWDAATFRTVGGILQKIAEGKGITVREATILRVYGEAADNLVKLGLPEEHLRTITAARDAARKYLPLDVWKRMPEAEVLALVKSREGMASAVFISLQEGKLSTREILETLFKRAEGGSLEIAIDAEGKREFGVFTLNPAAADAAEIARTISGLSAKHDVSVSYHAPWLTGKFGEVVRYTNPAIAMERYIQSFEVIRAAGGKHATVHLEVKANPAEAMNASAYVDLLLEASKRGVTLSFENAFVPMAEAADTLSYFKNSRTAAPAEFTGMLRAMDKEIESRVSRGLLSREQADTLFRYKLTFDVSHANGLMPVTADVAKLYPAERIVQGKDGRYHLKFDYKEFYEELAKAGCADRIGEVHLAPIAWDRVFNPEITLDRKDPHFGSVERSVDLAWLRERVGKDVRFIMETKPRAEEGGYIDAVLQRFMPHEALREKLVNVILDETASLPLEQRLRFFRSGTFETMLMASIRKELKPGADITEDMVNLRSALDRYRREEFRGSRKALSPAEAVRRDVNLMLERMTAEYSELSTLMRLLELPIGESPGMILNSLLERSTLTKADALLVDRLSSFRKSEFESTAALDGWLAKVAEEYYAAGGTAEGARRTLFKLQTGISKLGNVIGQQTFERPELQAVAESPKYKRAEFIDPKTGKPRPYTLGDDLRHMLSKEALPLYATLEQLWFSVAKRGGMSEKEIGSLSGSY